MRQISTIPPALQQVVSRASARSRFLMRTQLLTSYQADCAGDASVTCHHLDIRKSSAMRVLSARRADDVALFPCIGGYRL
jgi:hypothetical protein